MRALIAAAIFLILCVSVQAQTLTECGKSMDTHITNEPLEPDAEAVAMETSGEPLVIPERVWPDVAVQQEARMELDPWEDQLSEKLARLIGKDFSFVLEGSFVSAADNNGDREWRVSTDYLLSDVLSLPKERQSNNHTKRLAGIMRRLGWVRSEETLRFGKVVKRGFTRRCE
jgi:hypothetical protein